MVKTLLAAGADVTQIHPIEDKGCLHAAIDNIDSYKISEGDNSVIDSLLQHRACLGIKVKYKDSLVPPLVYAAQKSETPNWKLLDYLIGRIGNPLTESEEANAQLGYLLLQAVHAKRCETTKMLIRLNASRIYHSDGKYPLHLAVKKDHIAMLQLLLQNGFDVDQATIDEHKLIPLELACSLGHWECALEFFNSNPQFKFKQPTQGHRALFQAIKGMQAVLADKLIQAGAKIDFKLSEGSTCLHLAAVNDDATMIDVLIKNHARAAIQNKEGRTAIELACLTKSWKAARQLIVSLSRISPDPVLMHYHPALLFAIQYGNPDMTQLLLDNHASCKVCDGNGNAALHTAIINPNKHTPEIIGKLLKAGADPDAKNHGGVGMFNQARDLAKNDKKYQVCYEALLNHSDSAHISVLYQKDFLEDLLTDINEKSFKKKISGGSIIIALPTHADHIYKALGKMDFKNPQEINQNFKIVFDYLENANQSTNIGRLPETNTWYKEKWEAIKSVKVKYDLKETILQSKLPPSYQQSMLRSSNGSSTINLMNQFLLTLGTLLSPNPLQSINWIDVKPDQSLIEKLKICLQHKKETDQDSIRNTFSDVVEILSKPHEPWILIKENADTKKWREYILNRINMINANMQAELVNTLQTLQPAPVYRPTSTSNSTVTSHPLPIYQSAPVSSAQPSFFYPSSISYSPPPAPQNTINGVTLVTQYQQF